jgi:hypothetical protein
MTDSNQITPAAPKRRRRWPWIVGGLALAFVLFVLAAPSLFGGVIASVATSGFNDDHRGKLELGKLELAWFSRQKVSDARLLDPEGKEVARVSLDLPSLADLARSGGAKVGVVKVSANANLVADDTGLSNLQRALEENEAKKARTAKEAANKKPEKESKPTDIGALMRELDLALEISVPRLTWSDSHTRALGKPFELRDTVIKVDAKPGQPQTFDVKGKLASQNDAPLAVSGKLHDAFDAQGLSPKASFELQASVADFPSGLIDALAAQDGLVVALMGERFSVDAKGSGTLDAGRIDANLKGSDGEVAIACELKDRVLQGSTSRAVHVTSKLDAQRLQPMLKKVAPSGFEIQRTEGSGLDIAIDNLRVDLGKVLAAQSKDTGTLMQEALDSTRMDLTATFGSWHVGGEMLGKQGLALDNPRLIVQVAPEDKGSMLSVKVDSKPISLRMSGALVDGVWRGTSESALNVKVDLPPGLVSSIASKFLPPNTSLETVASGESGFSVTTSELQLPLAQMLAGNDLVGAALAGIRARTSVACESLTYIDRSDAQHEHRYELSMLGCGIDIAAGKDSTPVRTTLHVLVNLHSGDRFLFGADVACPSAQELMSFPTHHWLSPITLIARVTPFTGSSGSDPQTSTAQSLMAQLGPFEAEVHLNLALPKNAGATADVTAAIQSAQGAAHAEKTALTASLKLADPFGAADKLAAGVLPDVDAKFGVEGFAFVDRFLPPDVLAIVHDLASDDKLDGTLSCRGDGPKIAALSCELKAARVEFSTNARIEDRVLHIDHDEWLRLKVRPTPALLDRYVAASLPTGAKLVFADAEPLVQLATEAVVLPLDAWMPAEGKQPATLADVVRRAAANVQLALPGLNYEQPALTAGGKAVPIALGNMTVSASLTPAKPASIDVLGQIAGVQGGKIALHAKCSDPGAFLESTSNAKLPPFDVDGELTGMPTALVDALAAQNGLLVDTLGPSIDVKVRGSSAVGASQPLTLTCKSANASLDLVAQLDDMTLVAKDKQGLSATVPLNPLFSQRVVGKLVPLLVNASKPQGAAPVALQMSAFTLPLDGDMQKVNGTVNLSLGEVAYDLLPGLNDWLAKAHLDKAAKQNFKFAPMQIAIKDGVAHYDSLPINVAGEQITFKGSYSLVDSKLDLSTQLPLKVLGSAVGKELDAARGALDPNMLVPISIKGTWNKPKLSLGDGFLDKALKQAGGDALKKGLEGLLGGKKDKKKDG